MNFLQKLLPLWVGEIVDKFLLLKDLVCSGKKEAEIVVISGSCRTGSG